VAVTAPGFVEMQGGLPIVVDGEVICAIGASFDTPEDGETEALSITLVTVRVPPLPAALIGAGVVSLTPRVVPSLDPLLCQ